MHHKYYMSKEKFLSMAKCEPYHREFGGGYFLWGERQLFFDFGFCRVKTKVMEILLLTAIENQSKI
jgi:hypothetical protein